MLNRLPWSSLFCREDDPLVQPVSMQPDGKNTGQWVEFRGHPPRGPGGSIAALIPITQGCQSAVPDQTLALMPMISETLTCHLEGTVPQELERFFDVRFP
jgi:hypothetical protein